MKKILLLFVCLAANLLPGRAQMMPDSTVQVVAYWKLGDKQYYRYESTQFKIKQQDTVVAKRSAGIISMEVISADEEKGYEEVNHRRSLERANWKELRSGGLLY